MRRFSIRLRIILITNGLLLVAFFVTGYLLDATFKQITLEAEKNRLYTQAIELAAIAETSFSSQFIQPYNGDPTRLLSPGSDRYAALYSKDGRTVWQSPSMNDRPIQFKPFQQVPSQETFYQQQDAQGALFIYATAFAWTAQDGSQRLYTFMLAKTQDSYWQQVSTFRKNLVLWMGAIYLLVVVALYLLLQWGFLPFKRLAQGLRRIEIGRDDELSGSFPTEMQALVTNINALIYHERERQTRFRHALGDLAHSLKTPLAVMASSLDNPALLKEHIQQLDEQITYHLKRAHLETQATFMKAIPLKPIVEKIVRSMQKVYQEKSLSVNVTMPDDIDYQAEEGSLYEILGNLLENAFKYGKRQVSVTIERINQKNCPGIKLIIINDGEVVNPKRLQAWLIRGHRDVHSVQGQGIGLSVVHNIVEAINGKLELKARPEGGVEVSVWLPILLF